MYRPPISPFDALLRLTGDGTVKSAAGLDKILAAAGKGFKTVGTGSATGLDMAGKGLKTIGQAAATGAKATPGFLANTARGMAGLEPGQNFLDKPIKATANFATTPVWHPYLKQVAPRTATAIRAGSLGLTAVPLAMGARNTYYEPAHTARNLAYTAGASPEDANKAYQEALERTPSLAKNIVTGSDPTSKVMRDVVTDTAVQNARYGMKQFEKQYPWLIWPTDALAAGTPVGMARTIGRNLLKSDTPPDYNKALADAVSRHAQEYTPESLQAPAAKDIAAIAREAAPSVIQNYMRRRLVPQLDYWGWSAGVPRDKRKYMFDAAWGQPGEALPSVLNTILHHPTVNEFVRKSE